MFSYFSNYSFVVGEWWNGMEWDKTMFHCLVLQKRNGIEWSVMELIPSNTTH